MASKSDKGAGQMATVAVVGRLRDRVAAAGLETTEEALQQLSAYVNLLERWNRRMNLTGLGQDDRGLDRLVVEPLAAAAWVPEHARSMTDIGSGGGSPAVPMKLARPELALRMIESRAKKAAFLQEVIRRVRLQETRVETGRYEALSQQLELAGGAHVVTVRAVRLTASGLAALRLLVAEEGQLFLFKGPGDGPEEEPGKHGFRLLESYPLVDSLGSRLIVWQKGTQENEPFRAAPC